MDVTQLVGDQKLRYDALCEALPPIYQYDPVRSTDLRHLVASELGPICIDLEWDEDTGVLETIGVGNEHSVVQINWTALNELDRYDVRNTIEWFTTNVVVIYHSAWADLRKLRQNGFKVHPKDHFQLEDTMLAHAALHAEEDHTLKWLVEKYGKLPQHKDFRTVRGAESVYNAADVVETVLVWKHGIAPELRRDPASESIYRDMSLAYLCEIQVEQEEAGIRVDKTQPYRLRDRYAEKIDQAAKLAVAVTGWPINLKASDDVKQQLYGVDGLPMQFEKIPGRTTRPRAKTYGSYREMRAAWDAWKKKKVGPPPPEPISVTTDKDAIATLRRLFGTEWDPEEEPTLDTARENVELGGHPVLEARYLMMGAQQALSHYVMPCFDVDAKGEIVGIKDRIYPETRIHAQETGRISIVGPALSQFKGRIVDDPYTPGGHLPELQLLITPDIDHCWIGHDWSNIETWILGYLANDEVILEAKAGRWDTHTLNFCDVTGTPYPPILTKALHTAPECAAWREALKWQGEDDIRRVFAKRFVYRLHYRGKAEHAGDIPGAKTLGFDAARLVEASERYLARHQALVNFWARTEAEADRFGTAVSFMGRTRRLTNQNRNARNREACNHPMQAGVADIYITTALEVKRAAPYARLVFGSYDSMWWQVPVARKVEFLHTYKPIVEREVEVAGQMASFPGSFKERLAA